jgi:hypothetical protein
MWARIASVVLGIWLVSAPAVLGYAGPAATNDRIVGPLVASLAFIAIWEVARPLRRVHLVLGAWLLIAPLALGYGLAPALNSVVVGLLVILLSFVRGRVEQRFGGGWSSLLRSGPG